MLTWNFREVHHRVRNNWWHWYFAVFCRLALAAAFVAAGITKVLGERFTVLTELHPMGHFLAAFYRTGYYYTSVGYAQVIAALLLLIPRTATLGAAIYFPIIINICILSLAVRFDGSLLSAPLMVLANLYLLGWDFHKLQHLLPWSVNLPHSYPKPRAKAFPWRFALFSTLLISALASALLFGFELRPMNTMKDCLHQCDDVANKSACMAFCDCIHKDGNSLTTCLQ